MPSWRTSAQCDIVHRMPNPWAQSILFPRSKGVFPFRRIPFRWIPFRRIPFHRIPFRRILFRRMPCKLFFPSFSFSIPFIQPFYGCQRNARENITVTVSVRVSVTVRVSLVWTHRNFLFRKISKWHRFSANWDLAKCGITGPRGSALSFDTTFNLRAIYVTVAVYKNLAVICRRTNEHPLFIGPLYLHGHFDAEMYSFFFSHIALCLLDCSFTQWLSGQRRNRLYGRHWVMRSMVHCKLPLIACYSKCTVFDIRPIFLPVFFVYVRYFYVMWLNDESAIILFSLRYSALTFEHFVVEIEQTDRCCSETESVTAQICSGRNRTEPQTQVYASRRRPPWRSASRSQARW